MTESKAKEFLRKLKMLCAEYGAYCDIHTKSRPRLEHAKAEVSIKVKTT